LLGFGKAFRPTLKTEGKANDVQVQENVDGGKPSMTRDDMPNLSSPAKDDRGPPSESAMAKVLWHSCPHNLDSGWRSVQLSLKIEHGLLAHFKHSLPRTIEIRYQQYDRRKG
jgi:hypothetical protein